MYTKDNDRKVTVRLTEEQYQWLKQSAEALEVTPSKFLRMVVNSTLSAAQHAEETASKVLKEKRNNEHKESNQHNLI